GGGGRGSGHRGGRGGRGVFWDAAVDPFRRTVSAAGAEPHAAPPPHARGAARSIRGSRSPATDLALVRGRALGGCHLARAPRPDRRAGAPTASPSAAHLPTR